MIVIPLVDLQGAQGRHSTHARRPVPSMAARELADLGFARLHVEGGSAAFSNVSGVEELLRDATARLQVGGVTTTTDIDGLLRAGAESVVVGDRGIDEPEWLADVAALYPEAVALATDVRDRRVVRRGWVRTLPVDILDLVDELNDVPLSYVIVHIRSLDGAMRISELSLLEDVAERSRCPVFVAGGVSTIHDLRALEHRGIAGAVIDADMLLGGMSDNRDIAHEFGA
jgi:phosphoribosylformimino-5-aminoimidazole carboxamide ribotide isomerase